jgi:hypothetical protein
LGIPSTGTTNIRTQSQSRVRSNSITIFNSVATVLSYCDNNAPVKDEHWDEHLAEIWLFNEKSSVRVASFGTCSFYRRADDSPKRSASRSAGSRFEKECQSCCESIVWSGLIHPYLNACIQDDLVRDKIGGADKT